MNVFLKVKEICYVQDLESDNFSISININQTDKKIVLRYLNESSDYSDDFFQVDGKKEIKLDVKAINDQFNKDELKGNFVIPLSLFDKKQELFSKWISLNNYSKIKNIKGAVKLNLEVMIQYDSSNIISKKSTTNKFDEDYFFQKKSISNEIKNNDSNKRKIKNRENKKLEKNSFDEETGDIINHSHYNSNTKENKNNLGVSSASKVKENNNQYNKISVELKGNKESSKSKLGIRDKNISKVDNNSYKVSNTTCPVSSTNKIQIDNKIDKNNLIEEFDGNCEMDICDIKPNYNILDEELEFNDTFLNSKNEFSLFNSKTKENNNNNFDLNINEYDLVNDNITNLDEVVISNDVNINRPVVYTSSMSNIMPKGNKFENSSNNKINSVKNSNKTINKQELIMNSTNGNTNINSSSTYSNSNKNKNINTLNNNNNITNNHNNYDSKSKNSKIITDNNKISKKSEIVNDKFTNDNADHNQKIINNNINSDNKNEKNSKITEINSVKNNEKQNQNSVNCIEEQKENDRTYSLFYQIKKVQFQDDKIKLNDLENDVNTLLILKKNFESTYTEEYVKSIKDDKLILRLESAGIIDSYMEIQNCLISNYKNLVDMKKRLLITQQNLELKNHVEKKKNRIIVKKIQKLDSSKQDFYYDKMNELNKVYFHNALDKNYNDNEFQMNIYKSLLKIYSKLINDDKSHEISILNECLKRIQTRNIFSNFEYSNKLIDLDVNFMNRNTDFNLNGNINGIKTNQLENSKIENNLTQSKNNTGKNQQNIVQIKSGVSKIKDIKLNEIKEEDQAEVLFEKLMERNKDFKYEKLAEPRIYNLNNIKIEVKYNEDSNEIFIKDIDSGYDFQLSQFLEKLRSKKKESINKSENNNSLLSSNNQNSFSKKRINTLKSSTSKTTVKK